MFDLWTFWEISTGILNFMSTGKSFVVKHYYMMHMSNHNCAESKQALENSGENPPPFQYRCDICLKTFVSAEFLKNHKSRHRNRKNVQVIQLAKQSTDENQRHNTGQQQQGMVFKSGHIMNFFFSFSFFHTRFFGDLVRIYWTTWFKNEQLPVLRAIIE